MKYNYNEVMKKLMLIITALCFVFGFFSCSRNEPKILFGFMELVYYSGEEGPEERFSFFILPEDDDGVENMSELYLYHDREGLRWLIKSEDWVQYEEEGKIWIGSRNIAMSGDDHLPRGQYRAVLITKGGESTERRFTFDGPEDPPYPFPFLSINGGVYRIDSQYPVNHLICYDQEGNTIQTITITEIAGNIRDLRLSNNVRSAALWAEDPEYSISALTDAAILR
jgi:hypothetical protein